MTDSLMKYTPSRFAKSILVAYVPMVSDSKEMQQTLSRGL
jgi:hypothetical protein